MQPLTIITAIVVLVTYAGVAIGRVPWLRMNRATIALVGATILIAIGSINEKQAYAALDIGTILLLAAMMVINANLRMAGFFSVVTDGVLKFAKGPRILLALIIIASGVLSAIFLNDPVCILFTPLVIELCIQLKRDPIPYLVGLANHWASQWDSIPDVFGALRAGRVDRVSDLLGHYRAGLSTRIQKEI